MNIKKSPIIVTKSPHSTLVLIPIESPDPKLKKNRINPKKAIKKEEMLIQLL